MDQSSTTPELDLMVTEEVIGDLDDVVVGEPTAVQPLKKSKVLVTLSDDLAYTLTIDGDTLSALMDSISNDEYMKIEWHSWHRFVSNPNQFFVYIFDNDFKEYVRYRPDTPIRHLSKIRIKNKIYVNQSGLKSGYNRLIGSQSPLIDDMIDADTEPTEALISDQTPDLTNINELSAPMAPVVSTASVSPPIVENHSNDIINHNYHHNYHLNSPSAPASQPIATTESEPELKSSQIRCHNLSQSSKLTTKASKKLFIDSKVKSNGVTNTGSETDSLSGDLLADAPTGPSFDWTQEQTIAFLDLCKAYTKELAPKKNVLEVDLKVWKSLANDLNAKDLGSFDALMCRNHFSRLRLTYTNVLCYPSLKDETRWPYFEAMKKIIGEKPEEIQSKVKTRAQTRLKVKPKIKTRPELRQTVVNRRTRPQTQEKKPVRTVPPVPRTTTYVMKSVKNNQNGTEVSELYVALLNLVKKYNKYFETEKKNMIWDRIEKELNGAGFTWTATSLRGLFHRLRYSYLNIIRTAKNDDPASTSWPYYRYFNGLDLSVFRKNKIALKPVKNVRKIAIKKAKRRPGRPRKYPLADKETGRSSQPLVNNQKDCERRSYFDFDQSSDAEAVENKRKAIEPTV